MTIISCIPKCKYFESHFSEANARSPILTKPIVWNPIIAIFSVLPPLTPSWSRSVDPEESHLSDCSRSVRSPHAVLHDHDGDGCCMLLLHQQERYGTPHLTHVCLSLIYFGVYSCSLLAWCSRLIVQDSPQPGLKLT